MVSLSPSGQKGLLSSPHFVLGGGALQVPGRDPHLRMTLPLARRRSHAFPACIGSGTSPAYQGIYLLAAATMTVETLVLDIPHSLAQPLDVQL